MPPKSPTARSRNSAAVADASPDIDLKPDVLPFDGEVLLQRRVRAFPLVPDRIGIDRADDDGIAAGAIEMRRLDEAAVQRDAVHSAEDSGPGHDDRHTGPVPPPQPGCHLVSSSMRGDRVRRRASLPGF